MSRSTASKAKRIESRSEEGAKAGRTINVDGVVDRQAEGIKLHILDIIWDAEVAEVRK